MQMATFNNSTSAANSSSIATAGVEHFERTAATTTFLVPATTTTPLNLESFVSASPHFVTPNVNTTGTHQHHQHHQQTTNSTSSSYTFVQIKREPCQVSEVSSNQPSSTTNGHTHCVNSGAAAAALTSITGTAASSKTMSSSTLTTLVKIEASSPKVHDLDKTHVATLNATPSIGSTNNSVPIGIAVAQKRPQESTTATLAGSSTVPLQQSLNKDLNCFGIRVADLGGVGAGCGNIFFTGNGDLMTSSATAEELALNAAGVQSVNRAPSTFWQYPNPLPIESVISMSPATVGLQYSREASRGQVVLLPAPATALGISNFPLYTPTDPFQQAAAAFVWPSYIPQGAAPTAAALQPPPNFIFPSMSPHSTLQPQSYATSLQLFGSNYLTAAAAAAAAAAATSTLCQHNQQTNSNTTAINLTGTAMAAGNGITGGSSTTTCSSSSSSSSRFLSVTPAAATIAAAETSKHQKQLTATTTTTTTPLSLQPPTLPLPLPLPPPPLLVPPTALKIEEWNATEFMASAAKTTTTTLSTASGSTPQNHQLVAPSLNFEARDKTTTTTTTTTNLLELQTNGQSLNLMRLPTPPTSATIENAAATSTQLQQQILFHSAPNATTPAVINLTTAAAIPRSGNVAAALTPNDIATNFLNNATTTTTAATTTTNVLPAAVGPPTPHTDEALINIKPTPIITPPIMGQSGGSGAIALTVPSTSGSLPQMQDVNIQTDTPVCSEDESSSCPLAAIQQQQYHHQPSQMTAEMPIQDQKLQQPLELTKSSAAIENSNEQQQHLAETNNANNLYHIECHNEGKPSITIETLPLKGKTEMNLPFELHNHIQHSHKLNPLGMRGVDTTCTTSSTPSTGPEDLTGLELLSNISTSSLVKNVSVRIKQEPLEQATDFCIKDLSRQSEKLSNQLDLPNTSSLDSSLVRSSTPNLCRQVDTMPLGGLSLLCALAEQRIQEEVESSSNLFKVNTQSSQNIEQALGKQECTPPPAPLPSMLPLPLSSSSTSGTYRSFAHESPTTSYRLEQQSFPSMDGIELPSTSGVSEREPTTKHKKHKHSKASKSSKSSKSSSLEKKKSQRSTKKNKKKYSKEKRKHKLSPKHSDLDDEKLHEEYKSAFSNVDPNFNQFGNWPSPAELFKIMETDMRMRLADITRQYHKKKRKLEEINKKRKKRKCSKLVAQQQQATALALSVSTTSSLSLGNNNSGNVVNGVGVGVGSVNGVSSVGNATTSASLNCDYKFPKFPSSSVSSACSGSTTGTPSLLQPSSFLSFKEKTQSHAQFPPPDAGGLSDDNEKPSLNSNSSLIFKPVRLEPSALAASTNTALRLSQKHSNSEKPIASISVCKEAKLIVTPRLGQQDCEEDRKLVNGNNNITESTRSQQSLQRKLRTSMDERLMLNSEHLYRKETRVLTDMGGLFYAGVMKPLQPPDIYAITLDGERGNKPHIMSREEIFKDTILEVQPKTVESVPVGTRLCAYWSQQYRCLYPGRATGSEASDDGVTTNDFVSVEFDDGDSGRIRLQNIRFLLSDYPIAEYNDNPLYSLGKHKKASSSSSKTMHANETVLHFNNHSTGLDERSLLPPEKNAFSNVSQLNDLTGGGEYYARRTEKKRLKSHKKKAQTVNGSTGSAGTKSTVATANVAAAITTTTTTTTAAATTTSSSSSTVTATIVATTTATESGAVSTILNNGNECSRKHHKHKKHKKHKKHHHRKGQLKAMEGNNAYLMSINNKHDEDTQSSTEYTIKPVKELHKNANELSSTPIKMELMPTGSMTNGIKVKSENLDLEDETQSNMLSEVSDEAKCDDEVEHNNSKGSKIAAFLPERQLWGWLGKAYRKAGVKGRARKQFYKSIKRGKETITVRDCAVFLSTGRPDRPYIGRIESMWETTSSNKVVRVRWFYHPEETIGCPNLKYPGALFESPHEDENDVQTISHRCEVLPFERYFAKFGADSKQYQSIYDNNDTYYLAGYYNPRLQVLKLEDDIPTLEEQNTTTET